MLLAGYSWLSNQYGLTVDNIEAFELVLPNGTVTTVDSGTPDLFFSLKVWLYYFHVVAKHKLMILL